jgi:peroxiredoxin
MVPEDVAFTTCDGEPASLQGLCGRPALVLNWYGWCPSCETNAKLARRLAEEHEELDAVVVLSEDPVGRSVGDEFCEAYAYSYPSRAQLWTDPDGRLEIYGTTDLVLVIDREGRLTLVRETSNEAVIVDAVGAVTD